MTALQCAQLWLRYVVRRACDRLEPRTWRNARKRRLQRIAQQEAGITRTLAKRIVATYFEPPTLKD